MYHHVKKLMYTVRVDEPDPRFGNMLLEQFGGANGELAAAMQYSIQGLNCEDPDRKDLLMDILRVGVLCSHRAPGLTYLLDEDPNRGRLYDIACCLTTEDSFAEREVAAHRGIPVIAHPIRRFCQARGWSPAT